MILNFHKELVTNNAKIMTQTQVLIYAVVDRDEMLLSKYYCRILWKYEDFIWF